MRSTLTNLANMFRVPDLRNKILFTLGIIVVYRLGANIPCPGIDFSAVQSLVSSSQHAGVVALLNLFSGGALTKFAVFGLGIMPYITASIIIQLMIVVIPKFEQWREEGATGQKKLTQVTRYLTIALAIMQSTGLAYVFHNGGGGLLGNGNGLNIDLIPNFTIPRVALIVLTMTTGTVVVMWLGELITQRGIGQGMSVLIFTNVVSTMPSGGAAVKEEAGLFKFLVIVAIFWPCWWPSCSSSRDRGASRSRSPNGSSGAGQYGGQSTYIPMKVNTGGVVPIIFASSVLYFPILISNVLPSHGFWKQVQDWISVHLAQPNNLWYIVLYGVLIVGFAYFYAAVTFDPHQQAEVIRKQGGYIPGIRPGPPTERHLQNILNRITLPGSLWLAGIALLPSIFLAIWNIQNYPFAGTSLLIAVGVALETMKQVDSQLMLRNYEGFLK